MGALTFASSSHREGFLGHIPISDQSEELFRRHVEEQTYPVVSSAMRAGDVTFHSGWTLHCAPPNQTERMREVMTIIYFADGGVISVPDNPNRQADMEAWFPAQKPGEPAASPLNPLLYRR
jgi:ectoine hydroxylase-related dioxygenase (phytanoyl-CoA dioxygenase family)